MPKRKMELSKGEKKTTVRKVVNRISQHVNCFFYLFLCCYGGIGRKECEKIHGRKKIRQIVARNRKMKAAKQKLWGEREPQVGRLVGWSQRWMGRECKCGLHASQLAGRVEKKGGVCVWGEQSKTGQRQQCQSVHIAHVLLFWRQRMNEFFF